MDLRGYSREISAFEKRDMWGSTHYLHRKQAVEIDLKYSHIYNRHVEIFRLVEAALGGFSYLGIPSHYFHKYWLSVQRPLHGAFVLLPEYSITLNVS